MIISPENIYKEILKTGLPVDSHFMATNSFSWQELMINQKEKPSLAVVKNLLIMAKILQVYRDKVFKMPITITSGWRSEYYNSILPNSNPKSLHCLGLAIDFAVKNWTIPQVYDLMDRLHLGGVERTGGNWQHIDGRIQVVRFDSKNCILASHFDIKAHEKLFKDVKNANKI